MGKIVHLTWRNTEFLFVIGGCVALILAAIGLIIWSSKPDSNYNHECWHWSEVISPVEGQFCLTWDDQNQDDPVVCFDESTVRIECEKPDAGI
jgi:hypothetical protein